MEEPDGKISFKIANFPDAETRTQTDSKDITLEVGGQKIVINVSEENNFSSQKDMSTATKGAAFNNSTHLIPSITVSSIVENGNAGNAFFNEEIVSIQEGHGTSERFWPQQKLSFLAYAVSKDGPTIKPEFTRANSKCTAEFSYSLPAAMTTEAKNDATAQPDIVFAITPDQSGPSEVNLVFHHALSAINFKVGHMEPGNVEIKSIAIKGVYESGNCSLIATDGNDIKFSWTYGDETQSGLYTEDINMTVNDSDGEDNGKLMNDTEATFMMIPQPLSNTTKFVMTFSIEGREYTLEKAFNTILSSWEADKKYVFKIGLPDEIDVDIEDQVEEFVKKNVTIQNTGIATGYIRAAIVGYWINNSTGRICDPWRDSEGTFVYGDQWSSNWKKGSDGFYYHIQPVVHNDFTYPLFTTYTLNDAAKSQHTNHTLEMDLAVQIIPVTEKSVWPELDTLIP